MYILDMTGAFKIKVLTGKFMGTLLWPVVGLLLNIHEW